MIVGMWMTKDPIAIHHTASVKAAQERMREKNLRRLPVIAESAPSQRDLVGLLTDAELSRVEDPKVCVADIMATDVATASPETPIEDAAALLRDRKIGVLPVVKKQALVGIITESDIFRAFVSVLGGRDAGVRITFEVAEPIGALEATLALAKKRGLEIVSFLTMVYQDKKIAVVRLAGADTTKFVDDIWKSGHKVLTIQQRS